MKDRHTGRRRHSRGGTLSRMCAALCGILLFAASAHAQHMPLRTARDIEADSVATARVDSILASRPDSVGLVLGTADMVMMPDSAALAAESPYDRWEPRQVEFNPDPTRAVWMSALFPGLGQLYNRRYWKLPIVIGAYMGLGYATSWNNGMLTDYTRAYRDIMDNDPDTKSYMDFFPPTTDESSLDKTWLTNVLQSRKNFYRRNRDLCVICMIGVYFVAMVDAYVDASLSHFDISPDLSMDWAPAVFPDRRGLKPAVGLCWALNF